MERLLSDDFEADQSDTDALESEDSDAGAVEIQGNLPEALQSMHELSSVSDGDSDASERWASPRLRSRDAHSIIRYKPILYACFIF